MIPALPSVITRLNVKQLYQTAPSYAILVDKEYRYCSKNETSLLERAKSVYKIGCNPEHHYNKLCCNFKKLEQVYKQFS